MTIKRAAEGAIAALTGVAACLVLLPASATAVSRPVLTVGADRPAQATFGPILGNMPSSGVLNWFPEDCDSPDTTPPITAGTGAGAAFCDNVPIDVVRPNVDENTPWFVDIEVSWVDPAGTNDVDVFLWDDQQVKKRDNATGYTAFGQGATAENPERIRTFQLTLGRYNLVVLNYAGPNTGYTVKLSLVVGEPFQNPFELLEDVAVDTSDGDGGAPPAESGFSDVTGLDGFRSIGDSSGLEDLGGFQGDFGTAFGSSPGISDLPQRQVPGAAGQIAASTPGPASGIMMFIWLIVLPAVLIAGATTFIATRSRRTGNAF